MYWIRNEDKTVQVDLGEKGLIWFRCGTLIKTESKTIMYKLLNAVGPKCQVVEKETQPKEKETTFEYVETPAMREKRRMANLEREGIQTQELIDSLELCKLVYK